MPGLQSAAAASTASVVGGADPTDSWVALLGALSGNPARSAARDRIFIGQGLPTVPKTLVDKIQRWEFVDLAELLPATSAHDTATETAARFALFPGYELTRARKRQINTITEWVQAFSVLAAIILQRFPAYTAQMMAYQLTILKAAQQYDGLQWREYDTHFRVAAAATGKRDWSHLDTDLYTRFFTGRAKQVEACKLCDSTAHSAASCPLALRKRESEKASHGTAPSKRRRHWPSDVCILYNTTKCTFGTKCRYRHCCGECGGPHSAKACTFVPPKARDL